MEAHAVSNSAASNVSKMTAPRRAPSDRHSSIAAVKLHRHRGVRARWDVKMTIDEACAILKGQPGSIDNLGPGYMQRAYAAETGHRPCATA
jgi:hypothetical protein